MFLIFRSADELSPGARILLDEGEVAHARARRLPPGSPVFVGDGESQRWSARLIWEGKKSAQIILDQSPSEYQEPDRIVLSAMPKPNRRDWMMEKATELGMTQFIPCEFQRSVRGNISGDRFRRIVREASAQCEAWKLPILSDPLSSRELLEWLAARIQQDYHVLILDIVEEEKGEPGNRGASRVSPSAGPSESRLSPAALPFSASPSSPASPSSTSYTSSVSSQGARNAVLVVGPEGGFSPSERADLEQICKDHPSKSAFLQLGSRVLRTETAVLAGLSYLSMSRVSN
ncbi:MAG: RsmE family RNA methyltransferase [Leptospiraceae bacterium]|nr:RsmE family RNA methyltransferase [Leptospiraceae bacterium]